MQVLREANYLRIIAAYKGNKKRDWKMQAQPKVLHVVTSLHQGGVSSALRTLIANGFYEGSDMRLVTLVKGHAPVYEDFRKLHGADRVTCLDTKEDIRKRDIPRLLLGLHREFAAFDPDTAILSQPHAILLGRMAAAPRPHVNVVSFEHSAADFGLKWTLAMRLTSRRNDAVYGDTMQTLALMERYYTRPHRAYDVPLVTVKTETPREAENPEHFNILSTGRLSHEKNFGALILAIKQLANEGRKVSLTIAGEGKERAALEKLAADNGIGNRVKMPGWIIDFTPLHKAAHIYVQPSLFEGLCIATVEAMAAGVPTLATDVGGMRDYGNERNMVKIKGFGATDIAAALRHTMDNYASIAAPMSEAAVATMEERFGAKAVRQKWTMASVEFSRPFSSFAQSDAAPAERPGLTPPKSHRRAFGSPSGAR